MIDQLKILIISKPWFWILRTWLGKITFFFERNFYMGSISFSKTKSSVRIFGSIAWIGVKSLIGVVITIALVILVEDKIKYRFPRLLPTNLDFEDFIIEQLGIYAQLLTAIFSIYFATIGIILSTGYTRLRRDIIHLLTNEQVGSVYSRLLVFTTIFCLVSTALPVFGFEYSFIIYFIGTILTILSALALFPMGQRLFNFFDLNQLVRSGVLPSIYHHIKGASNPRNSISLANHHLKVARQALDKLFYIDDRIKVDKEGLKNNLPALNDDYTYLLMHYLQKKNTIDHASYWFPRRNRHKQWFLVGDSTTSMALETSNQQMLVEEKLDHQWLEDEIVDRLTDHIKLAFNVGDFDLAFKLLGRFSTRIPVYASQFQFEIGIKEINKIKEIIEQAFYSSTDVTNNESAMIRFGIADTWATLGSNFCFETLRRMMTFEKELKLFLKADLWSMNSLRSLPAFLQVELAFIVRRIEFEQKIEGQRLSKEKYVRQLVVQKLLQHYKKILPIICDFYCQTLPDFVNSLVKANLTEAATQVVLGSLHSHWKLPRWFDELTKLISRYNEYGYYTEEQYKLPEINIAEMIQKIGSARDDAISKLGSGDMVKHIFESKHNDELPDHFGQIYFELAEACISALEKNDVNKLDKVFPMFLSLAFQAADSKFLDPAIKINEEFRLHLISTVINDMASVLGYALLYGAYFDNEKLSEGAIAKFDDGIELATDLQQYLKRMILLSNPYNFSLSSSPRGLIRINWKMSFEKIARHDGFGDQLSMRRGKQHPNKIVREFLRSHSDASHLFFAKHIIPKMENVDFEMDYNITSLAQSLNEVDEEELYEDN